MYIYFVCFLTDSYTGLLSECYLKVGNVDEVLHCLILQYMYLYANARYNYTHFFLSMKSNLSHLHVAGLLKIAPHGVNNV